MINKTSEGLVEVKQAPETFFCLFQNVHWFLEEGIYLLYAYGAIQLLRHIHAYGAIQLLRHIHAYR